MEPFFAAGRPRFPGWLAGQGPESGIVLSTRARLARNLSAFPFPHQAKDIELATVASELCRKVPTCPVLAGGWVLQAAELSPIHRKYLSEAHLASRELFNNPLHRALVISPDLFRSALINEDDHLRLVAFRAGFDPQGSLDDVVELDRDLEGDLNLAFDQELGFLNASPGDLGTGLRLSVLIHLPGLVMINEIDKVINALRQLQFSVSGAFGSDGVVRGALFQVSNMAALGRSEQDLTEDFAYHLGKIIGYEKTARAQLLERDPVGLEDLVQRARAILVNARLITSQEALDRLSALRMGLTLDICEGVDFGLLNRALLGHRTAHLELETGQALTGRQKSVARATWLRRLLSEGMMPGVPG